MEKKGFRRFAVLRLLSVGRDRQRVDVQTNAPPVTISNTTTVETPTDDANQSMNGSDRQHDHEQDQHQEHPRHCRRKLRVLVVTLGGDRQRQIERMFVDDPVLSQHFEPPTFSPGVSSRQLRSRYSFFQAAADAGLLPQQEWDAIQKAYADCLGMNASQSDKEQHQLDLSECLRDVPVTTDGRRGSTTDLQLHYSVEFWRKAKTLNRGRAVLACVFAHLIAMKTFVDSHNKTDGGNDSNTGGYDIILEDNVRVAPEVCADQIWESFHATEEWEQQSGEQCHLRLVGWLSSITNLKWIFGMHIPKRQYVRSGSDELKDDNHGTIFPFPSSEFLEEDLKEMYGDGSDDNCTSQLTKCKISEPDADDSQSVDNGAPKTHDKPGGNPIWGNYGYWISSEGYHRLMETLRRDVGAMLWRGKRMKIYTVKPIDKIVPRQTLSLMGPNSVQISTRPAFFRAPMLTSKIHTQWDPEFCKSTQCQLEASGLDWSDLWLTDTERRVVEHHATTGVWLTPAQLEQL